MLSELMISYLYETRELVNDNYPPGHVSMRKHLEAPGILGKIHSVI